MIEQSKCIECETSVTPGPGFQLCGPCREAINNPPETMDEAFRKWWKTEPFTDEIRGIVKRGWDAGCAWTNLAMLERNPEAK